LVWGFGSTADVLLEAAPVRALHSKPHGATRTSAAMLAAALDVRCGAGCWGLVQMAFFPTEKQLKKQDLP
jgi:hypothetical protein